MKNNLSRLRLARHHFFAGNYTGADNLLQIIPSRYNLSGDLLAEFNDIAAVLQAVRPSLQASVRLEQLPTTVLDALETWASDCNEPGFIAKEILRRNGRRTISECDGASEERQQPLRQLKSLSSNEIRLYPNPAQESIFIELPERIKSASLSLYALDGRLMLQRRLFTSSSSVGVSDIPTGIYVCRIEGDAGARFHSKLVISR